MTRFVPHPILSCGLVLMWLLLNRFSPGHLLLGIGIALMAGRAMGALEPGRPRIRRPDLVLRLFGRVMVDIMRSNIAVARLIATGPGKQRPGFVEIALEIRDPTALAVLAVVLTSTPGTAWVDYDAARGTLLMHVLDLTDEADWRGIVNGRYGSLLKEICE